MSEEEGIVSPGFSTQGDVKKRILTLAGRLILENGGETYRAEESLERLCAAFGAPLSNVIAFPIGFFVSIGEADGRADTLVVRIKNRSVNLSDLDQVNRIVRALCSGSVSLADAETQLEALEGCGRQPPRRLFVSLAAGFSAACFTLLLGGAVFDCLVSTVCGFLCQLALNSVRRTHFAHFFHSALGGAITALLACAAVLLAGQGNLDKIIVGAIMPLLPGLAMVNAIRDMVRGDLLSGGARLIEMLLIAISLAAGVGVVLSAFHAWGGAVL